MEAGDWPWQREGREKFSGRTRSASLFWRGRSGGTAASGGENDAALGTCEEADVFCRLRDGREAGSGFSSRSFPALKSALPQ